MSLKELFKNGIHYLSYGGEIIHTEENGIDYYDLWSDDGIDNRRHLLCDGEVVDWEKKYNISTGLPYWFGVTDTGHYIYLTNDEYKIAVFA